MVASQLDDKPVIDAVCVIGLYGLTITQLLTKKHINKNA